MPSIETMAIRGAQQLFSDAEFVWNVGHWLRVRIPTGNAQNMGIFILRQENGYIRFRHLRGKLNELKHKC